MMKELR